MAAPILWAPGKNALFLQENLATPRLQKVRADFFGGFFGGFCKVNLRKGLPHRRSSRGHNWRNAKAHKIFPLQNLHRFLFLFHSQSHSHRNTAMHKTRSQRTCYPPQRKRATSAAQGQGGTTFRTPFSAHRVHNESECSKSPGSKAPGDPTTAPLQHVKADIPTSRNCFGKPASTQQSFL